MKKIFAYLLFAAVVLSSCEEDYLNRYPLDAITDQYYWKAASDLELYVNQFYVKFPGFQINSESHGIFGIDNNSDNMIPLGYNTTLAGTRTLPSSGAGWSWGDIRAVNIFLANYQACEAPLENYNTYVGEAMFFKAYFYFNLLVKFGDVPWYSEPLETNSEGLYDPRTSRNIVADNILDLLDDAINRLKPRKTALPFRVNKEVALLLKSRVALFEGTWEKYYAETPFGVSGADPGNYLQQAADAAKMLMDMGTCEIYTTGNPSEDYVNLFNKNNYSGISEIMLWKKFDFDLGMGHSVYLRTYSGNGTGLSKRLVEQYLCTDGLPISVSQLYNGDSTYIVATENRDPRLAQTIFMPGDAVTIKDGVVTHFEKPRLEGSNQYVTSTGYQIYKGHRPNKYTDADFRDSDNGSIVFRYAEALLNYAEAKAELGTINQDDINKTINMLRDRVGMPHMNLSGITNDPNWDFPTLSPEINEIRRERRVELTCEGYRFHDLCRWRAHHLIVGVKPLGAKFVQADYPDIVIGTDIFLNSEGYFDPYQKSLPNGWEFNTNRDYLSPIPTNELTLNKNLVQNPGW